ncbi:MAG: glycosyltransferase family 2 protein [Candidatus Rokubacteria bacterium]|nr:glycosyltransferase family 2 protein [Candidatus Rokubacteria bacterium]
MSGAPGDLAPPSFSVVVPALDEEANLGPTVEAILREFGRACGRPGGFLEVLVFDDASSDGTGRVADELARRDPRVRAFHNPRRLNIGGIYKAGLREARGEHYLLVPGDNEMRVDEIVRGARHAAGADLVVFFVTNTAVRGTVRRLLSRLYVWTVNALFGTRFRYTNGTNIFRTAVLRRIPIATDGFSYQTEAVVKAVRSGVDWAQVGIELQARRHGASKAVSWKNLRSVIRALTALWWDVTVTERSRYRRRGRRLGSV